jgi:hypothetical protein
MENFVLATAGAVGAAVVQEAVSIGVSLVLGKRKEKAPERHYLERLRKAVKEVEFMLERTAKLPITEVSLLRDRTELKGDFIEAAALLSRRHKRRQSPQGKTEISQVVTHSSSPHRWCPAVSSISSFITMTKDDELCLSCDDIERFEHMAYSAQNILRRVESACSHSGATCSFHALLLGVFFMSGKLSSTEQCKRSKKDFFMCGRHALKKNAAWRHW